MSKSLIKIFLVAAGVLSDDQLSAGCIGLELAQTATILASFYVTESAADKLLHRIQVFSLGDGQAVAAHNGVP